MKQKKKMEIITVMLVLLIMLCGCGQEERFTNSADSIETNSDSVITIEKSLKSTATDIVLVMDESGSMVKADKERLAIEAAKLFVDMGKTSGDAIALVEFSNQIISTGLIDTSQQQNKNHIKDILNSVKYSDTAHTDTGAGLLEAISILENSDVERNKVILLFTDGKTDIDVGTPGRTTEDSINDVNEAIKIASEKGYVIYCIGLNSDGRVDEHMLQNIADTTGGQYKIATNVNELPDFFNSIFADMDQSEKQNIDEYDADGDYHEVRFNIDNNSVMEANIVILSSKQVEDVVLTDPTGNLVNLQDNANITFSESDKYSLIKLFYPASGEWSIQVKGVSGDHIKVSLINNYDIELAVEVEDRNVVLGQDVTLKAYLVSNGEKITDKAIYQNLSGYINAISYNSYDKKQETLQLNDEGDALVGQFKTTECTLYNVSVHVEGSGFYRDSEPFNVEAYKIPPSIKQDMDSIKLGVGKNEKIDLSQYFIDEDGADIKFSIQNDNDFMQANAQGNELLLLAEKEGKGVITIIAENGSLESTKQEVEIMTVSFMQAYGKMIALLVVIVVVITAVWLNNEKKKKIYGSFQISVISATRNQYGTFDTEDFVIMHTLSAEALGKHGFNVGSLSKLLPAYYIESDEDKKQRFVACVAKMQTEAIRVKVNASKKPYKIVVKNKSAVAKLVQMNSVSERKEMIIDLSDNKFGISNVMEKEFGVRFYNGEDEFQQISIKYKKM